MLLYPPGQIRKIKEQGTRAGKLAFKLQRNLGMKIKIWGSRGSIPVNGEQFDRYSGETACIEVRLNNGEVILLDAGTGLKAFATAHKKELAEGLSPVICLSHTHLDHVQGLPFYGPIYGDGVKIHGPQMSDGASLENKLGRLFDGVLFPVKWEALKNVETVGVAPGSSFKIGSALVEVAPTNHPGGNLAWKITADGQTLTYTGDHEIPLDDSDRVQNETHARLMDFITGSGVAILDCHFSGKDHAAHKGWGHSDVYQWGRALYGKNIGKLVCFHFSPDYTDNDIDNMMERCEKMFPELDMTAGRPGMEIDMDTIDPGPAEADTSIYDFLLGISHLSDTHAILDALLVEGRKIAKADAGTIYLLDQGDLVFAAAHNDTLFPASAANKYAYMNARIPLDRSSVAGYVASTGKSLNIPDVYQLDPGLEYCFNDSFDRKTGYRTKSMLAVPLVNGQHNVIGVLQLINAREEGQTGGFDEKAAARISRLANLSTLPLEKALLVVNMIMRMLQTSALRDPTETSSHVQRVGSVAAELYHAWADARNIDPEKILANKSRLRLAAMLHDIGKVGIPDGVLKKPGRLDDDERRIMQTHSALGAGLFDGNTNEIDQMARSIALHHHAKWDGSGYTGTQDIPSPAGEEIPIWARIVAIADVYDALVSRRCYKDAWDPSKAMEILHKDAGTHFDPELVARFEEIQDIISTIYQRYNE